MLDPKRIAPGWWIAIVAVPLLVGTLLVGLLLLDASFTIQRDVRSALQLNDDVLRYQLDEETGLRGYIATGNVLFLEPYNKSAPRIDDGLSQLSSAVGRLDIGGAYASVTLLQRTHDEWVRTVSQPVIDSKQAARARGRLPQAKQLMDRFRAASAAVRDAIEARADAADRATRAAIVRMTVVTIALVLLATAGAVLFGRRQCELSRALDHERELVRLLQTAFVTRLLPLPRTQIGTAYLSATAQAPVGGDFFDVRRLDATYGYSEEGAMTWISQADATNPQALADELLERVQTRVGGTMRDDLAILSLRVAGDAVATEEELLADIEEASGLSFVGDLRETFAGFPSGRATAGTAGRGAR